MKKEGQWVWTNPQGKCSKYRRFRKGEPNGKRGENCAIMYKNWNGEWNDAKCNGKSQFICEVGIKKDAICPKATTTTGKLLVIQ